MIGIQTLCRVGVEAMLSTANGGDAVNGRLRKIWSLIVEAVQDHTLSR